MNKIYLIIILIFFLYNCSNQTNYSGKILNQDSFKDIKFENKKKLIANLGTPSFIDPVSKKYFYYAEKKEKKSIFNKKLNYSYVFVFEFDDEELIIASKVFDLKEKQSIELIEEETSSDIIKRGLLERIFGGVGPQQEIATTP